MNMASGNAVLGTKGLYQQIACGDTSNVTVLLQRLHNINIKDESGQTPLICAANSGRLDIVIECLRLGGNVRAMDEDKWTPLICAAKEGHTEVVEALLDNDANVNHADTNGWTALMWASYKGHADIVRALVERNAYTNVQAQHGVTPIIWSAGRGHTAVVKILLEHGAKADSSDKYGTTGLVWAARKGHIGCVRELLDHGANPDIAGMNSWTALIVASRGGYIDVVERILEEHPNINAVDKDGLTALSSAAKEGHADIVDLLLNKGSYVNIQDKHDDTVLIHAVKGNHIQVVKVLLVKYADVDIAGNDKRTALFWAVDRGNPDIVELLLEFNAETEICSKDGEAPLLRATRNRSSEIVRLLLDYDAKVSTTDKRGDTPLHLSIRFRDRRISELLLRNPKDGRLLYKPNRAGETPYNIDASHQKGILTQIFGAKSFTPGEDIQGELSELYCSSLADMLSEPTLSPPITVGLYARWGSGKCYVLKKLQEELKQYASQSLIPLLQLTWAMFGVILCLSGFLGVILFVVASVLAAKPGTPTPPPVPLDTDDVASGPMSPLKIAIVGGSVFLAVLYIFLFFIKFSSRKKWHFALAISSWLASWINYIELLLKISYLYPPSAPPQTNKALPIRFVFADRLRLTNIGGETPLARTVGTLCSAVEKEFGFIASRLARVLRTKVEEDKYGYKWRCCVPQFALSVAIFICFIVSAILLAQYQFTNTKINIVVYILLGLVAVAILVNLPVIMRFIFALSQSPKTRVLRSAKKADKRKTKAFLRVLKNEVELLSQMIKSIDAFLGTQTRLVVIVDGLDSCEQEHVLRVLDSVHSLFNGTDSPYITILALDPYIITKAIDQNLHEVFKETNINGHDYLRNIVHLPFYLQAGIQLQENQQIAAVPTTNMLPSSLYTIKEENEVKSQERPVLQRQKVLQSNGSNPPSPDAVRANGSKRPRMSSVNQSSVTNTRDVSKLLMSDEQFSDLSPRSMRRLLNIVSVTGRLLRAHGIEFKWQKLASWVNMTERWPYRTSWLVVVYLYNETSNDDELPLQNLYEKYVDFMPSSVEIEPKLDLDQDLRNFQLYLSKQTTKLTIEDIRKFLPCSCSLDPQLRKHIRDTIDNTHTGSAHTLSTIARPNSFIPSYVGRESPGVSLHSAISETARKLNYTMNVQNPFQKRTPQYSGTTPTVKDVCDRLLNLDGLDPSAIPRYQAKIAEHNINGHVLQQCDIDELRNILGMSFGDWQIFRGMVLQLRDQMMCFPCGGSISSCDQAQNEPVITTNPVPSVSSQSHNDYLNLSFEELRKSSRPPSSDSSTHSAFHTSHPYLGMSPSEHHSNSIGGLPIGIIGINYSVEDEKAKKTAKKSKIKTSANGDGLVPAITTPLSSVIASYSSRNDAKFLQKQNGTAHTGYSGMATECDRTGSSGSTAIHEVLAADGEPAVFQIGGDENLPGSEEEMSEMWEEEFPKVGEESPKRRYRFGVSQNSLAGSIEKLKTKLSHSIESLQKRGDERESLLGKSLRSGGNGYHETHLHYNRSNESLDERDGVPLLQALHQGNPDATPTSLENDSGHVSSSEKNSPTDAALKAAAAAALSPKPLDSPTRKIHRDIDKALQAARAAQRAQHSDSPNYLDQQDYHIDDRTSHEQSLLSGYSFYTSNQELPGVPESDNFPVLTSSSASFPNTPQKGLPNTNNNGKMYYKSIQSMDEYSGVPMSLRPLIRSRSTPNQFSDESSYFTKQVQEGSMKTLDQSFEAFVTLTAEQSNRRHVNYDGETASPVRAQSSPYRMSAPMEVFSIAQQGSLDIKHHPRQHSDTLV
ncbi:uncharacterized protein [Antedon mediterranea]